MAALDLAVRPASRAKHLRKQGLTPVALFGRDGAVATLSGETQAIRLALGKPDEHGRIALRVDGRETSALVKKVDYDVLSLKLIHVSLREVADDDTVRVEVPVVVTGHTEDADQKGVELIPGVDHVTIEGRVADIPDHVEIDASSLHVGEHLEAADISLPEGVELVSPAGQTVAKVEAFPEADLSTGDETESTETAEPAAEENGERTDADAQS